MSNECIKPEIPDSVRELMKLSIEQAQRVFETFVATSEKTWNSFEVQSQSARSAQHALNSKIAEITRENAEASFALAMRLAESKDIAGARAPERARQEADGEFRPAIGGDARPRRQAHPGCQGRRARRADAKRAWPLSCVEQPEPVLSRLGKQLYAARRLKLVALTLTGTYGNLVGTVHTTESKLFWVLGAQHDLPLNA
jgi:hypothetical protein